MSEFTNIPLDKNSFGPLFNKLQDYQMPNMYEELQKLFHADHEKKEEREEKITKALLLLSHVRWTLNKVEDLVISQHKLNQE